MGESTSPEKRSGCGLLNAVFGRRSLWPRRSTSTGSLNQMQNAQSNVHSTTNSRSSWDGTENSATNNTQKQTDRIIARPGPNHSKAVAAAAAANQSHTHHTPPVHHKIQNNVERAQHNVAQSQGRRVPQGAIGISGELDSLLFDNQRSENKVGLFGNLGNLRQPGTNNVVVTPAKEELKQPPPPRVSGNDEKPQSLCRALSTRMDPEELKIMGNEDYKNGRFADALALYDAAISIDPNKASYRSNKSAALSALGRLLEAVFECREAIRIEPFYQRAHNRLATLYVRLGEAENAMYHYKQAGPEADPEVMAKAKNLQALLSKCTEAKRQRDWNGLLRESSFAISAGADSAPQIFALKAEALIRLHRYHDADEVLKNGPQFGVDECTRFFGPIGNASLLIIQAQVNMAAGRVDEAREAAEQAAKLDSNSKEIGIVAKKMQGVANARSNGNALFKAGKFSEACVAYGEGLDHDPYNAVLLSNRAACLTKLGEYEEALEDCSSALTYRPSYSKARLRRCDCLLKMGNLEACIQECEMLMKELLENEEVVGILTEAKLQLSKPLR